MVGDHGFAILVWRGVLPMEGRLQKMIARMSFNIIMVVGGVAVAGH